MLFSNNRLHRQQKQYRYPHTNPLHLDCYHPKAPMKKYKDHFLPKEYKHLVSDFAKMTGEKNLNRAGPSQFHTTSLLELDARGIVESDDGEITALLRAPAPARR